MNSKAAWGLSVPPQTLRICTKTSNSLSWYSRQQEGRYPIHACQQLINEGFRYFQTVIVTAVVYWSLYQKQFLTLSIHFTAPDKGQIIYFIIKILHNPVFLINSRHPHFCAINTTFQFYLFLINKIYGPY